jgi:WD40 repeat protein/serine/threonine protein kinase
LYNFIHTIFDKSNRTTGKRNAPICPATPESLMTNLIGQSLGRYHILEQLGEGGMATVYKAYDTRLERDVAIKIIRRGAFPPNQLERILKRFEREAKALAKLSHPNIVGVIDYGEYEDAPYLVMEYLPGGTLKQRIGKPIPWQEAIRLLIPVAQALEYAHEQNIIHRDVKPSNILLTVKGQPMLTDFGIAKILETNETFTLTGTGVGVGTPEYMAPEQWTGQSTQQSDVYSLGVVLYEMITGRKPYAADTPAAILLKQANDPLPRPISFVRDLPEMVEKILIKALAKNSDGRYRTVSEFVHALENLSITYPQERTLIQSHPRDLTLDELPPTREERVVNAERADITNKILMGSLFGGILVVCIVAAVLGLALLDKDGGIPSMSLFPTKTATPLALPVLAGTPLPVSVSISPENTGNLKLFGRWGEGIPNAMANSLDGRYVALATSVDVKVFEADTLELVKSYDTEDAANWISALFVTNLDQIIGACGDGNSVQLWDVSSQTLLRVLDGHSESIVKLEFSHDGSSLISGSSDHSAKLWRVADGSLLRTLDGHTDWVRAVAFSPEDSMLATGSDDKSIKLWRVSDGSLLHTLTGHSEYVYSVAFSPDGSLLASASGDDTIKIWRVMDGSLVRTLEGHSSSINSIAFSPDGSLLASGSSDKTIKIWRVLDGQLQSSLNENRGSVYRVLFPEDQNSRLFSFSLFSDFDLWNLENSIIQKEHSYQDNIYGIALSPDGFLLALGVADNTARILNTADGSLIRTLEGHTGSVRSIAFSPDGSILATGSTDRTAKLWRTSDGSLLRTLEGHTDWVRTVALSPDGALLATGSDDKTIMIWRVSDGSLLRTLTGHSDYVMSVAFSPNGEWLASGSDDDTLKLWRVSDGSLTRTMQGHSGDVYSVAFSPNGVLLASGAGDNTVKLWSVSEGSLVMTLTAHTSTVDSVAFSPNGELLASGAYDRTLRLWRVSDGSLLQSLEGYTGYVSSVAFLKNGSLLASGSGDGLVRFWGIDPVAASAPSSAQSASGFDFSGDWVNEDSQTRGITRLSFTKYRDSYNVEAWGSCSPTDCYWNEGGTYTVSNLTDASMSILWTFDFKTELLQVAILADGRLKVMASSHYTDGSGRDDQVNIYYFVRDQ